MWVIDARQLIYTGTGLASVTAEILRVFASLGKAGEFAVVCDVRVEPSTYLLDESKFVWIRVPMQEKGPDYIDRIRWSRAVLQELKKRRINPKLFMPYAFNYGNLSQNVVWIPDLINRIVPLAEYSSIPFWAVRRKFYLRRLAVWLEERRVNKARYFISYSEFVREHACEIFGLKREKFLVAPLAVGETLLKWRGTGLGESFPDLPEKFALYVGGYGSRKNVLMLLRACGGVGRRDPEFRCLFVGLTQAMVDKDENLRELFRDEAIKTAAVFCPKVSDRELAGLYQKCLFSLYPSRSEGFGLPIVEAGAFGKLCLCGDNSSMREIQTFSGYRIATEDQQAWSEKIHELWSQPDKLREAEPRVAELAARYDWVRSGEAIMRLLRSLENETVCGGSPN